MASGFGRHIRRMREAAGLSLRDVARGVGVSHVYLGEVERGRRGPILRSRWRALTEAIPGLTMADLQRLAVEEAMAQDSEEHAPLLAEIRELRARLRLARSDAEIEERGRVSAWFRVQAKHGGWVGLVRKDLSKEFLELATAIESGAHLPGWPRVGGR